MKKIKHLLLISLLVFSGILNAQVAINTTGSAPDGSAMLDVVANGKGVLIPRMTQANRPSTPALGLLIFQTDATPGFYYWDGASWIMVGSGSSGTSQWTTTSNDIYNNNIGSVGIGTNGAPDANAMLDITSSSKGILIPRIFSIDRPATPTDGLLIYQIDGNPGFYYYTSANGWQRIQSGTTPVANGGTGATTANAAINNLLPSQGGNAGLYLTTDGSNPSWAIVSGLVSSWTGVGNDIYNKNTGSVGIGTAGAPNSSAILELKSPAGPTKGLLLPRVTSSTLPSSPATGLLVFQTDGVPGFYYYTGTSWTMLNTGSGSSQWSNNGSDIYFNTGSAAIGNSSISSSAILDLGGPGTSGATKGLILPRMTYAIRSVLPKVNGLVVTQTDNVTFNPAGVYFSNGGSWAQLASKWNTVSNSNNLYYTTGAVGIGITVPAATQNYSLLVSKSISLDYPLYVENTGGDDTYYGMRVKAGAPGPSSAAQFISIFDGGGTELGYIGYDGSALQFYAPSDSILKEQIRPTAYNLETILKIKVRDFNWKKYSKYGTVTGFIAQELYDVYPAAVVKPKSGSNDKWMISQTSLIPLLVKSIQDQQSIIKSQGDKINNLEQRLNLLEQKLGK